MKTDELIEGALHERRFSGAAERLRDPERVARLEVPRVVMLSLEGLTLENALDVGTGTGIFAEAFANSGLAVTGIDTNAELLTHAREYAPGAWFEEARAEDVPFEDRAFDLVFLGHVLHETDDPLAALEEAHRVARHRVVILEWPYREQPYGPPLAHRIAPAKVTDLATRAGFPHVEHLELDQMDFYRLAVG